MKKLTMFLLLLLSAGTYAAEAPRDAVRVNAQDIAIDGYSPVSYFTEGKAQKGLEDFALNHEGVEYWFTDAAQRSVFEANPKKYLPAHGGWCTLMMAGSGRRTPGHPESFAIVDDRLMLFWSGDTAETKGLGMSNWMSKTRGSERRALRQVENADKKWVRFLEGRREAKIFLYKPSDFDAVSAAQLTEATVAFQQ